MELIQNLADIIVGNPVLSYIGNTCVTVSVAIVFLLLIRPFMKRLPRIGMYILWFVVALRVLCPFSIHGIYRFVPQEFEQAVVKGNINSQMQRIVQEKEFEKRKNFGGKENAYRLDEVKLSDKVQIENAEKQVALTEADEIQKDNAGMTDNQAGQQSLPEKEWKPEKILLLLWAAGVIFCIGRLVFSLIRIQWRYKDATCLFENVYTHPLVYGSFVSGIITPRIYIPETLTEEEQGYILCHERVHVRRRDYLVKPFVFAVFSLLWFNPFIWVAYYYMMKDMEISCDEMAVRQYPEAERKKYSYLLLSMTSGEIGISGHSPAFNEGEVKERIVSIMRYKRPTVGVTLCLVLAVTFCGCGIASAPKDTINELPGGNKDEKHASLYVEQAYGEQPDIYEMDGYSVSANRVVMDADGRLVQFAELYDSQDDDNYSYAKMVLEGKYWEVEESRWLYGLMESWKGKNYEMNYYQYGEDGFLYLQYVEYSMSRRKFWEDREKYREDFYVTHSHLLKIDEEKNEITEIPIPQRTIGEVYKELGTQLPKEIREEEIAMSDFSVFSNGDLLFFGLGKESGVYSGVTGECLTKLGYDMPSSVMESCKAGDGFWAYLNYNSGTGLLEVQVVGEDGTPWGAIPTEVPYDPEEGVVRAALTVRENSIILATGQGIFEAEAEDTAFTSIINPEKDNLYYLSPDGWQVTDFIGAIGEDKYAVQLYNDKNDNDIETKVCVYEKPY